MSKSKEQFMEQREQDQAIEPSTPTVHQNTDLSVPKAFNIANKEVNKATIIAKRTEDVKHVITGIEDKAGYKKAIELRAEYRTLRTSLEKHRKTVSQPINQYLSDLKKATDDLGKEALVGEEYFDTLITEIDNEKLRIENEKKEAKAKLLKERVALLIACNGIFDGAVYNFDYAAVDITLSDVESLDEKDWDIYVDSLNEAWATEQARIKQKEADEAKESKRLSDLAIELQAQRTFLRAKELTLEGFDDEDESYYLKTSTGHQISKECVAEWDNEEFSGYISDVKNYVSLPKENLPGIPMHDVVINEPVTTETVVSYVQATTSVITHHLLQDFEDYVNVSCAPKLKKTILSAINGYKELMA